MKTNKIFLLICMLLFAVLLYANETFETRVEFHGFPWGTSMQEFITKVGEPANVDRVDGLWSLVYDNLTISEYPVFMVVFFSINGLEGGTYYFHTFSMDELMQCYTTMQEELLGKFGPTLLCDVIFRELRPYETLWNLDRGCVYLNVNTQRNVPVTLWYSSPSLTKQLFGS